MTKPFTDIIFQQFKLFLEGVQVPFTSISITQGIGGLPEANIVVPAQAGLMDVANFYQPKVHIFFVDRLYDYDEPSDADKLMFSGLIAQVSYQKSKDTGSNVGISFRCVHRYSLMNELLIDYSGWLGGDVLNNNNTEAAVKSDNANSAATVIEALAGVKSPTNEGSGKEITKDAPDGQTNIIPERYKLYYNRLLGMPGVMMNFWNQMKRAAYNRALRQGNQYYSEPFIKMYQPLAEDGLQFFDRIGGHWPVEAAVQADENRVDPCPDTPGLKEKIVIPPARQLYLASSAQAEMTISNVASYLQNSGESTTIYQIFSNFYDSIDYEILTLASPAEVSIHPDASLGSDQVEYDAATSATPSLDTYAIDTIVKPRVPFYFSPTCNVLFPNMYRSINVMYDEISIPTRINLRNLETRNGGEFLTNFRSPNSVREAIAKKVVGFNSSSSYDQTQPLTLSSTMISSYGAIGQFEQGRGIRQESGHIPRWLSYFSASTMGGQGPGGESAPQEAAKKEALRQLSAGWAKRYPDAKLSPLNPYSTDNDIQAHQRMLFSAADYAYTMSFARSKAGSVECPFNPFITPGYPMDILESNPLYPSFHAMCTSVTHNISADSIGTSVQFTSAMTYSEMANYYIPVVSPMLQVTLGLAENPTLLGATDKTKLTAQDFYKYTLGTPAVTPDDLMDFGKMAIKPKALNSDGTWTDGSDGSIKGANGGETNPMLTYEGTLTLAYRDIEARSDVEERFGIKFIEMTPGNYGTQVMLYKDKQLTDDQKFEIGRSQFLTYDTYFGTALPVSPTAATTTSSSSDGSGGVTQTTDSTGAIDTSLNRASGV